MTRGDERGSRGGGRPSGGMIIRPLPLIFGWPSSLQPSWPLFSYSSRGPNPRTTATLAMLDNNNQSIAMALVASLLLVAPSVLLYGGASVCQAASKRWQRSARRFHLQLGQVERLCCCRHQHAAKHPCDAYQTRKS